MMDKVCQYDQCERSTSSRNDDENEYSQHEDKVVEIEARWSSLATINGFKDWLGHISFRSPHSGYFWFTLSAVAGGLGNSLEPVSVLAILQTTFLIAGLHIATWNGNQRDVAPDGKEREEEGALAGDEEEPRAASPIMSRCRVLATSMCRREALLQLLFVVLTQAAGFCLGFASLFSYPAQSAMSLLSTFLIGALMWTLLVILSVLPHRCWAARYPDSSWAVALPYPLTHTALSVTLVGRLWSTLPAVGNAVLDFGALKQTASLTGIFGVTFLVVLLGTVSGLEIGIAACPGSDQQVRAVRRASLGTALVWLCALVAGGFLQQSDLLYQRDAADLLFPRISASCVFGEAVEQGSAGWATVWNSTAERVLAGDSIVLMAEEALQIYSDKEEQQILSQGRRVAMSGPSSGVVYVGVSYLKTVRGDDLSTNHFALVSSDPDLAQPLWNYRKAFPVPLIEADIEAGPAELPVHHSQGLGLTLGGAICFDMDYPSYILQAGAKKVDLMLQPSWTWGAILTRHMEGNAVRAVENGFSMLRCSLQGESGVVDRRGQIVQRQFTGSDPAVVAIFSVPVTRRTDTVYVVVGFAFEWIAVAVAALVVLLACGPKEWTSKYLLLFCDGQT